MQLYLPNPLSHKAVHANYHLFETSYIVSAALNDLKLGISTLCFMQDGWVLKPQEWHSTERALYVQRLSRADNAGHSCRKFAEVKSLFRSLASELELIQDPQHAVVRAFDLRLAGI